MAGDRGELDFDLHSLRRISYVGVTFRTRGPEEVEEVVARTTRALGPALTAGA
jgi:NADPH2:quinone reductase